MHKAREHQQPVYNCFVDFKKSFDWWVLNKAGVKKGHHGLQPPKRRFSGYVAAKVQIL